MQTDELASDSTHKWFYSLVAKQIQFFFVFFLLFHSYISVHQYNVHAQLQGEQTPLTHTCLCSLSALFTNAHYCQWPRAGLTQVPLPAMPHPGKQAPSGVGGLRCKPPECQDPIAAPISPCSPTFLLSHFPFSLMTHITGYATQEAERYTQTNGISILAFQGWSAPNHYDFMIKSLKKSPQTI